MAYSTTTVSGFKIKLRADASPAGDDNPSNVAGTSTQSDAPLATVNTDAGLAGNDLTNIAYLWGAAAGTIGADSGAAAAFTDPSAGAIAGSPSGTTAGAVAPITAVVVNLSGNADIDGALWGYKWSQTNLTFSFPTDANEYLNSGYLEVDGFKSLNAVQMLAEVTALGDYASYCNLTFTQTTDPGADLRFGQCTQYSSGNPLGVHIPGGGSADSNTPDPTNPIGSWGDAWFSYDAPAPSNDNSSPVFGGFIYTAAFMHELGHNLGLKQGQITQTEHGVTFPTLPADHDSQEYSIMTYDTYPGNISANVNQSQYPETPMQDDIAALQYLYGANYYNVGSTQMYRWDPLSGEMSISTNGGAFVGQGAPGQNHILETIWDGGGTNTYDFSNYTTDIVANLNPGQWINLGTQLADLDAANPGSHIARGNIGNALSTTTTQPRSCRISSEDRATIILSETMLTITSMAAPETTRSTAASATTRSRAAAREGHVHLQTQLRRRRHDRQRRLRSGGGGRRRQWRHHQRRHARSAERGDGGQQHPHVLGRWHPQARRHRGLQFAGRGLCGARHVRPVGHQLRVGHQAIFRQRVERHTDGGRRHALGVDPAARQLFGGELQPRRRNRRRQRHGGDRSAADERQRDHAATGVTMVRFQKWKNGDAVGR
jgi:Peptidase M10 serralysin C terminal